ncbi:hypothetical protein NDU88_006253 [Pleurodeles waltl]|uniref:Uncharacterized protein n=1 Tax=Pleurodeles waltl TaxID=8319 RepID=A0AAV7L6F1_PLEWA|nr:hypothetical protein NDU88_006253 [Pleurodeles waltl]
MAWSTAAFRPLGVPCAAHPETNSVEYSSLPTPMSPLRTPKPMAWVTVQQTAATLRTPVPGTPKPMAWSTAAFRPLGAPCAAHPETNGVEYCGLPTPRSPLRCAPRNQWRGVERPSDP